MLADKYDERIIEIVRLSFYAGAVCSIDHLFARQDHGIALIMLRAETRDFVAKLIEERAA